LGHDWIGVGSRPEPIRVWTSVTAVGNYADKIGA
jgi:hypothetical protein